jgi:hypothetical protein
MRSALRNKLHPIVVFTDAEEQKGEWAWIGLGVSLSAN